MADVSYMTKEGYDKLRSELDDLKSRGRIEVANAIAEARDKGDLSENAEYEAAKDAQGMLELKINELEIVLSKARIIDGSQLDISKVTVLSKVKIKNLQNKKEMVYQIVSEKEANLREGKISVNSPIGEGLLGKKVGETATIQAPSGKMDFQVLDISL